MSQNHQLHQRTTRQESNEAMDRSSEGTETASLLSCDSEDSSLAACGSDDYSEYVDKTGRRQEEPDFGGKHDRNNDEANSVGRHSDTNKNQGSVSKAASQHNSRTTTTRSDGLAFDMNEPWQRSLLRQLEKDEEQRKACPRPGLMFLGHSESRDFGMEVDQDADDVSLGTNSSNTIPTRGQFIHRMLLMRRDSRNYQYEDEPPASSSVKQKHAVEPPASVAGEPPEDRNAQSSNRNNKEHDSNAAAGTETKKIPDQLPDGKKTSVRRAMQAPEYQKYKQKKQQQQQPSVHYLELEPSVDEEGADMMTVTMAPDDTACFCMGYDVWDYIVPPPEQTPPSKGKRFAKRTSKLRRVDEDFTEIVDLGAVKAEERAAREPVVSCEPEGSYDPSGAYYYGV